MPVQRCKDAWRAAGRKQAGTSLPGRGEFSQESRRLRSKSPAHFHTHHDELAPASCRQFRVCIWNRSKIIQVADLVPMIIKTTAQSGVNARQTEPPMQIPHTRQFFVHAVATGSRAKNMKIFAQVPTLSGRGFSVLTQNSHGLMLNVCVLAQITATLLWFGHGCSGDRML